MNRFIYLMTLMLVSLMMARPSMAADIQRANFIQNKTIKGLSRPLQSHGQLVLFPDQGLLYRVEKPVQAAYLMGDSGLVIEEAGQRKKLSVQEAPWLRAMAQLLPNVIGGNKEKLTESFAIESLPREQGFHWRCVPHDGAFRKALPVMDIYGDKTVQRVVYSDSVGGSTELLLTPVDAHPATAPEQSLLDMLLP